MPLYTYRCERCKWEFDYRTSVGFRDTAQLCRTCNEGLALRVFTPTANIVTPEHFRYLQSDFLPQAGDTAAWESRAKDSQAHVGPKRDWGREYQEFVERDLREQGARL